jgi:putative ABC transport system permease protein
MLASGGLYGVMAFNVRRRTPEIGIRMALGADRFRILRMVLRQGTWLLAIGLVLGAGLGYALSTQLGQLLFQVSPWDVSVYLGTFVVLTAAALVAMLVPARRASAVDPLVALRAERRTTNLPPPAITCRWQPSSRAARPAAASRDRRRS